MDRTARSEQNSRFTTRLATADGTERVELVEQLTLQNLDVARSITRRFARRGAPAADLEQVAYLALFRAARDFDQTRGEHFMPWAVACVRGAMLHYFRDEAWMIRPPRDVQRQHYASRGGGQDLVARGVPVESCFRPAHLDCVVDYTPSPGSRPGDRDPFELVDIRESLRPFLTALTPRARLVLHLRFFEDCTQQEIGDRLGITQIHVSRLLRRHVAELRTAIEEAAA